MPRTRASCRGGAVLLCLLLTATVTSSKGRTCRRVRFATYNTSLNRNKAGELLAELRSGVSEQAANVSAILQTVRPDILVLNEFDYERGYAAVNAYQDNFLSVPQAPDLQPLRYPYVFTAPVNTGIRSGRDFDHDGRADGPADAFGYGFHPGQYGMVLLSQFPIDAAANRTWQHFLYRDLPGALLPKDPLTGQPWYDEDDLKVLRLSSKSHWDVPVDIELADAGPAKRIHMLLHHPTPPAFDGAEGRNLRRNHDEIRLMADIVGCGFCGPQPSPSSSTTAGTNHTTGSTDSPSCGDGRGGVLGHLVCAATTKVWSWVKEKVPGLDWLHKLHKQQQQPKQQPAQQQGQPGDYLYDDAGRRGGLDAGASFVIAGDHNADPLDGSSFQHAIQQLRDCCNITAEFTPVSEGGKEAGNKRPTDRTPPETKTATFGLRVDYLFPSKDLKVVDGAVFWPTRSSQPQAGWVLASDHRLVYLDVDVCADGSAAAEVSGSVAEFVGDLDELVV